ncbi:MAG: PepSY domain-containing protein [Planctomycetes bacterium]|nr:PepSY domain-containing protein [Planctomycetota bacterium]
MNRTRASLLAIFCLAFASYTQADEEKVPLDKLPAKVKAAVKAKFPDAELLSAEKETEDGKTLYEVDIKNKGQKIEVTVDEDGKIVEIEKEIAAKDLPKVVLDAIEKKYPKATITKAEEITTGEKVKFEMLITVCDKKLEVSFDPQGKFLEEEDKSKKK